MGSFSIWHWIIVGVIVLLLFGGRGKLSGLMGDAAKGINAFRKGLKESSDGDKAAAGETTTTAKVLPPESATVVDSAKKDQAAKT
jgi:sec-independent protein translocase protein TatA